MLNNKLGIVYRDNILLKDRNLKENLKFILNIKNPPVFSRYRRINKILNIVDLDYCTELNPEELNSHQLIRANLAQALLSIPDILILEDPFYKLDELNHRSLVKALKNIVNKLSITILLLTTDTSKRIPEKYYYKMITINKGEIRTVQNKKSKIFN